MSEETKTEDAHEPTVKGGPMYAHQSQLAGNLTEPSVKDLTMYAHQSLLAAQANLAQAKAQTITPQMVAVWFNLDEAWVVANWDTIGPVLESIVDKTLAGVGQTVDAALDAVGNFLSDLG